LEKKPKEFALEYAGFWIRLGAGIIDLLILAVLGLTILFTTGSPSYSIIGVLLISFAYFVGFWTWRGQTPGKMAVLVKVIRTDHATIDWRCALRRFLGYITSTLMLLIGFIWIAFDSRKQGTHDKIADTYVVKLPVRQVAFTGPYARGHASYG